MGTQEPIADADPEEGVAVIESIDDENDTAPVIDETPSEDAEAPVEAQTPDEPADEPEAHEDEPEARSDEPEPAVDDDGRIPNPERAHNPYAPHYLDPPPAAPEVEEVEAEGEDVDG